MAAAPAAAPDSESAAAPGERKRRDERASLANEEMPERFVAPRDGAAFRAGGSSPQVSKAAPEAPAAEKPAPSAREKREVESFAARQAPEPMAGAEAAKEADDRLEQQSTGNTLADAAGNRPEQPLRREITIEMDASGRNNIPMQGMLGGATLRIKPQQPVSLGGDVAIRIKSADGRRELREIHTASRDDGHLEMTVPPGWMADGMYSVEVWPLDALPKKPWHRH
jgi:hypothetical protein